MCVCARACVCMDGSLRPYRCAAADARNIILLGVRGACSPRNIADVSLADVDLAAVAEEAISTSPRLMRVMHGVEWPRLRCPLTFLVLLIGVPHPKNKNLVVFEHIAEGLVKVRNDGCSRALMVRCGWCHTR